MARPRQRRRKCLCCKAWFTPDPRRRGQQRYCSEERCRKASKVASQRRWLRKPQNENYFHGHEHVDRVQRWRHVHSGYWRRQIVPERAALQDLIDTHAFEAVSQTGRMRAALQDVMATRPGGRLQRTGVAVGVRGVSQQSSAGCG